MDSSPSSPEDLPPSPLLQHHRKHKKSSPRRNRYRSASGSVAIRPKVEIINKYNVKNDDYDGETSTLLPQSRTLFLPTTNREPLDARFTEYIPSISDDDDDDDDDEESKEIRAPPWMRRQKNHLKLNDNRIVNSVVIPVDDSSGSGPVSKISDSEEKLLSGTIDIKHVPRHPHALSQGNGNQYNPHKSSKPRKGRHEGSRKNIPTIQQPVSINTPISIIEEEDDEDDGKDSIDKDDDNTKKIRKDTRNDKSKTLIITERGGDMLVGSESDDNNAERVTGEESETKWKEGWQRWYVLAVLCFASFVSVLVWGTISSAKDAAMGYYNMTAKRVDLTSQWAYYLSPFMSIYASWVLTLKHGVRRGLRHIGLLTGVGAAVRLLPCFAELIRIGDVFGPTSNIGQALLQAGQIIAALCFPLLFCVPSALSAVWFPAQQRTRATTLGLFFPLLLGTSAIHVVAPYIAPGPQSADDTANDSGKGNRAHMLSWVMLIVAAVAAVAIVLTFTVPKWPRYPPSESAARHRLNAQTVSSVDKSFQGMTSSLHTAVQRWWQALCAITHYRSGVFTIFAAAFTFSTLIVWQLSLTQVLISSKSAGSLVRANYLSLSHLVSALVSAFAFAWLGDTVLRRRSGKLVYFFYVVFALLIGLLLAICAIPPSKIPEVLIGKPFVIVHLAGIGVAAGAVAALTFEWVTETLYPIQEGLSIMYPAFLSSILVLIVEIITPHIGEDAFGLVICLCAIGGSVAAMVFRFFAPVRYPRLDLDYGGRMIDYSQINK